MRKITIIIFSALIALSLATYFQTTRAILLQALQGATSLQYARVYMITRSFSVPFISQPLLISLPTIKFNIPQIASQAAQDSHNDAKGSEQQAHTQKTEQSTKRSPLALLTAPLALILGGDALAQLNSDEQKDKTLPDKEKKQDKVMLEAEEIINQIFKKLNSTPNANVWATLHSASFEDQDKFLSQLMEFLMNPNDKHSYKAIAFAAKKCTKLWEKHKDLYHLIATHAEKPKAQEFLDQFNALEDAQLPPYFAQAREKINEACNALSLWQKGKIWWKF